MGARAMLDTRFLRHPKILALSDSAVFLYLAGLLYSKDFLTDGALSRSALPALCQRTPNAEAAAGELVAGGLWDLAQGGWQIHDYLDWNEPAVDQERRLAGQRERMRRFRAKPEAQPPLQTSPHQDEHHHQDDIDIDTGTNGARDASQQASQLPPGGGSSRGSTAAKEKLSEQVSTVLVGWLKYHPRGPKRLAPQSIEYRRIRDRLAEGYTVEDLHLAIDGIHKDPFHCGENDRGTKYQSMSLCFRDSGHVDKFIAVISSPAAVRRPQTAKEAARQLVQQYDEQRENGVQP